jgi:hypothetical protein
MSSSNNISATLLAARQVAKRSTELYMLLQSTGLVPSLFGDKKKGISDMRLTKTVVD